MSRQYRYEIRWLDAEHYKYSLRISTFDKITSKTIGEILEQIYDKLEGKRPLFLYDYKRLKKDDY